MRDCGTQDANEHGDGEIAVAASDQRFGTTSPLQSFEGKEVDQVFRHGAASHQIIPEGTWVWGKGAITSYLARDFMNQVRMNPHEKFMYVTQMCKKMMLWKMCFKCSGFSIKQLKRLLGIV